jgi:hypothetical protein
MLQFSSEYFLSFYYRNALINIKIHKISFYFLGLGVDLISQGTQFECV